MDAKTKLTNAYLIFNNYYKLISFLVTFILLCITVFLFTFPVDLGISKAQWKEPWVWMNITMTCLLVVMVICKYYIVGFNVKLSGYFNIGFDLLLISSSILSNLSLLSSIQIIGSIGKTIAIMMIVIFLVMILAELYVRFFRDMLKVREEFAVEKNYTYIIRAGRNILLLNVYIILIFSILEWALVDIYNHELLNYTVPKVENVSSFFHIIYYNTITFFGLGYGDIVPVSNYSRFITMFELHLNHVNTVLILVTALNGLALGTIKKEKLRLKLAYRAYIFCLVLWITICILFLSSHFLRVPPWSQGYSVGWLFTERTLLQK